MDVIMLLLFGFIMGITAGFILAYFYFDKKHKDLSSFIISVDEKYNRLISLISDWQKKL